MGIIRRNLLHDGFLLLLVITSLIALPRAECWLQQNRFQSNHATRISRKDDITSRYMSSSSSSSSSLPEENVSVELQEMPQLDASTLIDMDVVIFTDSSEQPRRVRFGAVQEDGRIEALSVWTTEPAFGSSLEFLVDEKDRFSLKQDKVQILYQVTEDQLSYGSRQCARGVHNPHGEESELLYYIDQNVIDKFEIDVPVKPELEMLW